MKIRKIIYHYFLFQKSPSAIYSLSVSWEVFVKYFLGYSENPKMYLEYFFGYSMYHKKYRTYIFGFLPYPQKYLTIFIKILEVSKKLSVGGTYF